MKEGGTFAGHEHFVLLDVVCAGILHPRAGEGTFRREEANQYRRPRVVDGLNLAHGRWRLTPDRTAREQSQAVVQEASRLSR